LPYHPPGCVIGSLVAMTFQDEVEVRRPSVGTKVLMVGLAIFAVLGSFWTIVWFIRVYVEAPRVNNAPMALAARESTPVVPPAPTVAPAPIADPQAPAAPPSIITAAATVEPAPPIQAQAEAPAAASAISDRWLPMVPAAPASPPAEPMTTSTIPAALASTPDAEPASDEVAETSVPAISGAAPLPRRKPTQTAAVRPRNSEPPLPRPRPDGPAPQSVWTAVPTTDDRYQAGQ
jgi:hypothetical protein